MANKIDQAALSKTDSTLNRKASFAVVESYKTIRTNLMFLLSQSENKRLIITSAISGEGKSTTSINIAIAFSQLGSRVLLIDADMRKPTVHKKLKLQNNKGLSSVLVGFCDISDAIHSINPNLDVLTAGSTPPNPSELLGSANMVRLLDSLNEFYEYIIFDTPPINIVSDALVLAPHTSGMVLVVQNSTTTHEQFKKALSSIEFANAKLLGAILNGSKGQKKNYKYGYYDYYYYK
ncbi:MAG TPA: CpsD/CapB family tyrosine-protein kinase [Clostridiales bacterium]|nr:CpsD/CapB family tyrosine-protein kinase [Clostridiales bacterium]